jgi:hypothetical protein
MARRELDIQQLRTELQVSRWEMHDNIQKLEDHLNVPRRLMGEFQAHPIKWAALAVGLGIVAATTLPLAARLARTSGLLRLLSPALRMGLVAALPLLKLATHTHTLTLKSSA